MVKISFNQNDDIVILVESGKDYIQQVTTAQSPFTLFPSNVQVSPTIQELKAAKNTSCYIDLNDYIQDSNNVIYCSIVGPRPKNIVRR